MRSRLSVIRSSVRVNHAALVMLLGFSGCTIMPNYFREDGPASQAEPESPSAMDIRARQQPVARRVRDWPAQMRKPVDGTVEHLPPWFEDPFVDKGHGRTEETDAGNVYRAGWEDYVAMCYGPARFFLNGIALPVSGVVSPPWQIQESDGFLSRQALGYDHDAISAGRRANRSQEAADSNEP